MVNATLLLYKRLTVMLKSCTLYCLEVLKASISLILFAVADLQALSPSEEKDETNKKAFATLKSTLWEWIIDHKIVKSRLINKQSTSWSKDEFEVQQRLASFPGCVGGEKRPGTDCLRMRDDFLANLSVQWPSRVRRVRV